MSLREISAGIMAMAIAAIGIQYLVTYIKMSDALGGAVPPPAQFITYAATALIAIIVVEVVLAVFAPRQADQVPDERERPQLWRAGHWAGLVQGGLCIAALYHVADGGNFALLFHLIVGSLIVSQVAEYALQIVFLRRSA